MYNGVVLHEWTRLPVAPTNANVRRAVFAGAQACAFAWGKGYSEEPKWVEDYFDYESEFGVGCTTIWGAKKTVFNSIDFGSIVVSTYADAP